MIMHYAEARRRLLETTFWKFDYSLNCSLFSPLLRNNKQSDKKCRHKTIVKTMAGPDLRLSVGWCLHNYESYQ